MKLHNRFEWIASNLHFQVLPEFSIAQVSHKAPFPLKRNMFYESPVCGWGGSGQPPACGGGLSSNYVSRRSLSAASAFSIYWLIMNIRRYFPFTAFFFQYLIHNSSKKGVAYQYSSGASFRHRESWTGASCRGCCRVQCDAQHIRKNYLFCHLCNYSCKVWKHYHIQECFMSNETRFISSIASQ